MIEAGLHLELLWLPHTPRVISIFSQPPNPFIRAMAIAHWYLTYSMHGGPRKTFKDPHSMFDRESGDQPPYEGPCGLLDIRFYPGRVETHFSFHTSLFSPVLTLRETPFSRTDLADRILLHPHEGELPLLACMKSLLGKSLPCGIRTQKASG